MNIKKMGRLLSLWAFASVAGISAKGESMDVEKDVFGQTRLSTLSTNGVSVSFATGYKDVVEDKYKGVVVSSITNTYPVLVEDGKKGFATAHTNMPEFADIAVDQTSGKIYASAKGRTDSLYELSLSNVSSNEMMNVKMELAPKEWVEETEKESFTIRDTQADRLLAFDGQWIVAITTNGWYNANIFHINGNINFRQQYAVPMPNYVCETTDKIYFSNGNQTASFDRNSSERSPAFKASVYPEIQGVVGLAGIGTNLYQATTKAVYRNGMEIADLTMGEGGQITSLASDGKKVYISYSGNEHKNNFTLDGGPKVIYVKGGNQLISSQNTVYQQVGNHLQQVRE